MKKTLRKPFAGIRFDAPPLVGTFERRYKRFFADVRLDDGTLITAHCPNTGSLAGCKEEGRPAWLRDSGDPKRKLRFTWQAIRIGRGWVNVDTSLPNRVAAAAVEAGAIPELEGYANLRREVKYGENSRIDLFLSEGERPDCYVEVKSTTLADKRVARFPDAVTERGRKHLNELAKVASQGKRAVQFFLISRGDVDVFRPADDIDPAYGEALRRAVDAGVEPIAWTTRVRPRSFELKDPVPIEL